MPSSVVLPPTYYHAHFVEMADFVAELYHAHLDEGERAFLFRFRGLSIDGQCLFLRMANRKRGVFTRDDLKYAEITDREAAIAELIECGFARRVDARDYEALLSGMSKDALRDIAERADVQNFKPSWPKLRAVEFLIHEIDFDYFSELAGIEDRIVPVGTDDLHFLLYLYFGRLQTNLTSFALRDMGIVSVTAREGYKARFKDMAEARAGFFYARTLRDIKGARAGMIEKIAHAIEGFPEAVTDMVRDVRDDILFRLGSFFEKRKDFDLALSIYAYAESFSCRERIVRILHTRGELESVRQTLDHMMQNPASEEEHIFASDFYERKFGASRAGIFTSLLKQAESITVDDAYRGYPEYAAIRHYEAEGYTAHHVENGLWPTLFALVFWDQLFETAESFSSAFDAVPQPLKDKSFYARHKDIIDAKLAARDFHALAIETIRYHEGQENGLFYWFDGLAALVDDFLSRADAHAVATILEKMAHDFYAYRDGFPDLLLIKDDAVRFVEIKGEGDSLRRNQLARLQMLKNAGFAADIVRVHFRVDPDQVYVVVDVETTGGRPPFDRVTEIGAVKIQNGNVIDTFQTLINPERLIPAGITQLTGITNAMVRGAPKFGEIADEFEAFMGGAVFVAHNVNFDHGFIASEFRRLDRDFRFPKMCTVAMMRKHYPGNASYSLANLCYTFDIELENHHRALDDAKAAAELLMLINRKRLAA